MERGLHKRIVVFRPLYAVGGQELGYLPGSESDKMNPWAQAVYDTLSAVVSENVIDEVMDRGLVEVLPLSGRRPPPTGGSHRRQGPPDVKRGRCTAAAPGGGARPRGGGMWDRGSPPPWPLETGSRPWGLSRSNRKLLRVQLETD